jgi:hypothetical protein
MISSNCLIKNRGGGSDGLFIPRHIGSLADGAHNSVEAYTQLYQMVCTADIDVIAHFDLMKRYAYNVNEIQIPVEYPSK